MYLNFIKRIVLVGKFYNYINLVKLKKKCARVIILCPQWVSGSPIKSLLALCQNINECYKNFRYQILSERRENRKKDPDTTTRAANWVPFNLV